MNMFFIVFLSLIFWFLFLLGFYDRKQITDSNGNKKEMFIGVYGDICLANNFLNFTSMDRHINNDKA